MRKSCGHRPPSKGGRSLPAVASRRHVLLFVLAGTVSCGTPSPSAPSEFKTCTVTTVSVLVKAGDTLTMNFTVPAISDADVLTVEVDRLPSPIVAGPAESCQLFDGSRLISSDTSCAGTWQSTAASVRLPDVPQIDFSTIAAGTFAGRLNFVITGGSWAFDGKGSVSLGRAVATPNRPTVTYLASGTAAPMQLTGPSCR